MNEQLINPNSQKFQKRLSDIELRQRKKSSLGEKQKCNESPIRNQQRKSQLRKSLINNIKNSDIELDEKFNYNPFQQPADFDMAMIHRQAKRVGKEKKGSTDVCPCCNNFIDKSLIKLNCNEKELAFLGSGYSLYFKLTKYFSLLIILILIIGGSFTFLITNFYCEKKCVTFLFIPVMDLSHLDQSLSKQTFQNIFVGIVITVVIIYMKPFIFENIFEYNDNFISPSHYTLCIKNLPLDTTKEELKNYFEDLTKDKVIKVNLAYDLQEYTESFNDKIYHLRMVKEYQYELKQIENNCDERMRIEELQRNVKVSKNRLLILEEKLAQFQKECLNPSSQKFIGTAFISFQHQMPVRCILEEWGLTTWRQIFFVLFGWYHNPFMKFKDKTMIVEPAAAPTDIIWENLEFQSIKIAFSNISLIIGSLVLLTTSFSFQFWTMKYVYPYKRQSQQGDDIVVFIIAMVLSLVIVIINVALRLLVFQFTKLVNFDSVSKLYSAYINRYIFLYFANSAFIPYIVHGIFDAQDDTRALLVQDIHFIMLASSFSTPLSKIFEIDIMIKLYFRRQLNRFPREQTPYTQHEANQIFEDYVIDIADSYAFISRTLFLSAWYASVAPVGILFGLSGMLLNYWIDKFQLLRMQSIPQSINEKAIKQVINILEIVPIIYIIGSWQYELRITKSENVIAFILNFLGYGVSNIFLVVALLAIFIFGRQKVPKGKLDKYTYESVRIQMRTEYDSCNPITKYQANRDWIKFLYQQKIINKQEKSKLLKKGDQEMQHQSSFPIPVAAGGMQGTHISYVQEITPRLYTVDNIPNDTEYQCIEMVDMSAVSSVRQSEQSSVFQPQNEDIQQEQQDFEMQQNNNILQQPLLDKNTSFNNANGSSNFQLIKGKDLQTYLQNKNKKKKEDNDNNDENNLQN